MSVDELFGAPNEERHLVHIFQPWVIHLGVVAPHGVAVIVGLLAMVGEIHHHGILLAEEVDDTFQHIVVVERGVVVVGNELPLPGGEVWSLKGDAVGGKPLKLLHVREAVGGDEVLSHEVEHHKVVLAHLQVARGKGMHDGVVAGKTAVARFGIRQAHDGVVVEEGVDGEGIERVGTHLALIVPEIDVVAGPLEDGGEIGRILPAFIIGHTVAAEHVLHRGTGDAKGSDGIVEEEQVALFLLYFEQGVGAQAVAI